MRYSNCLIYLSPLILLACTKTNTGAPLIPEESFIKLYADMLVVRQEGELVQEDSLQTRRRIDSLYTRYGVTSEQFDLTAEDHKKDLPRWREFYAMVVNRLDSLQRQQPKK